MPLSPIPIGTRFEADFPTSRWIVTFDKAIVPDAPTDATRWDVLLGGTPIPGITAAIESGEAVLRSGVFSGAEDDIRYIGPPPFLQAADTSALEAFLIPAVA